MIKWFILSSIFLIHINPIPAIELDRYRILYESAYKDKIVCKELIIELTHNTKSSVHLAYLGAFQSIWAKHTFNPIQKLKSFEKGREHIENAVTLSPDNLEIRLIRLSIQKHCPGFLGYKKNLREDSFYIAQHQRFVTSPTLLKLIHQIL